jgi:formylglycine-generating enzyme required for sulfatase activity
LSFLVIISSAEAISNPFYRKSLAVLIAVENYKSKSWEKMLTPVSDAKGLEKFLKSRDFIVDTFFDKEAMNKSIKEYFEEILPKKCGHQDRVIVFLSGHFYQRKALGERILNFYVPYGGKKRRVGTMISLKQIKKWCDDLRARHVLLLVNGNWNNFTEKIVEKDLWKPRSKGYYRAASRKKARQVITAGYTGESFSESGPSGTPYSLFAGNLIIGLKLGVADIDNDGIIGVSELAAYLVDKVYQDAQQYQKPVHGILNGNEGGEMIFLSREAKTKKTLSKALSSVLGTVKVTANVSGATIYVDNRPRKKKTRAGKPVSLKLSIGKHTIKLSKKYYLDVSAKTFVSLENTSSIKFSMKLDPTLKIGYMVPIKDGQYTIGVKGKEFDSGPAHHVRVDSFHIGKYEVTNAEYMEFVKATGYPKPPCIDDENFRGPEKPVVCVSWNDAIEYCKWKSLVTGRLYRLPTEAEWEIAARGQSNRKYPWGDQPPKDGDSYRANYASKDDGYACTAQVRSFEAGQTPNKLFHMGGNVYEWCSDWYGNSYYSVSSYRNPTGPEKNLDGLKVIRGGSWLFDEEGLYCTSRGQLPSQEFQSDVGFRAVMIPKK